MIKALVMLFVVAALSLHGQTWEDAVRGGGTVPRYLAPVASMLLPDCQTEDSDDCFRDSVTGDTFMTMSDVTIIFD